MYQQMAALSFSPPPTARRTPTPQAFHVPLIQNLSIPMQQLLVGGGSNQSMVYQSGGGGQRGGGRGGRSGQGGRNHTLFANHMAAAGRGRAKAGPGQDIPQFTQMATPGAFSPAQQSTQHANPPHSNNYKKHNNWNACFSCRFNVEYGHMLQTFPAHWRKGNHQESYVRTNTQQLIDVGYDLGTKGMHKPVLPTPWYNLEANKCKNIVSA